MNVKAIIDKAMKKADGAQAALSRTEGTDVGYENDRIKAAGSEQQTGMSLRVVVKGKVGSSHTTDIADVDGLVKRALEAADFGSTAHYEIPGPAEAGKVKTFDKSVLEVSRKQMVDRGGDMLGIVKAYNKDIMVDTSVGTSVTRGEFANSAGVHFEFEKTGYGMHVSGQLVRGTDMLWAGDGFGWCKSEIDHKKIADKTVEYFRMAEKNVEVKSGEMPVIFTPRGSSVILLALRMGINGKSVFLGSSPLKGKLDTVIADERITITDDPLVDYASGSSRFDGEGVPHKPLALVEKGVLKNFLYDLDTAGRAGTVSTGHGPGCGLTNVIMEGGDKTFEEMVRETENGLLVHSVLGLGQGNPISGEFSVNVHLGYKIENGKVAGRIKDVMLAGNTYDALKNLDSLSSEAEWASGSLKVPYIKIKSLSVVAKG